MNDNRCYSFTLLASDLALYDKRCYSFTLLASDLALSLFG